MRSRAGAYYTNNLITYSTVYQAKDKRKFHDAFFEKYGKDLPYGFRFDGSNVKTELKAVYDCFNYPLAQLERIDEKDMTLWMRITQLRVDDIDQGIAELDKELKRAGIDKIIAEANRQLAEWRKVNP